MRLLIWLALIFAAGCSCDFLDIPPDECADDWDCPDDEDGYCNGAPVCEWGGLFQPKTCSIREPDCGRHHYCDAVSDYCRPCESIYDGPECRDFDAGQDAGPLDAGPRCGFDSLGAECGLGACGPELECVGELNLAVGAVERVFLDSCSVPCEPSALDDGCPPCAACLDALRIGEERVAVADVGRAPYCALRCEPSTFESGCARDGFSCDPLTGTCQDACVSDAECRLVRDESGALVEDPTRAGFCDSVTGRCRNPGTGSARIGDACTTDAECPSDGVCLRGNGWPEGGYCVRFDCQWPALACGEGEACHQRALDRPACVIGCEVGAEPFEDQLGVDGHGAGCSSGFACRWTGDAGDVDHDGGCVPGNYNDVAAPNLGAPCTRDDECYSPFGMGRCLWAEIGMGMCSRIDCAHARLRCDPFADCAPVAGETACLPLCTKASQCAPGHACVHTPSGARACAPSCTADADCREGERCDGVDCIFGGACRCLPR